MHTYQGIQLPKCIGLQSGIWGIKLQDEARMVYIIGIIQIATHLPIFPNFLVGTRK